MLGSYIKLLIYIDAMYIKTLVSWNQLSYAFIGEVRLPRTSATPARLILLVTPQTVVGRKFLEVEKQVVITWSKVGALWRMFGIFPLEISE